jgi:hypothetical protein
MLETGSVFTSGTAGAVVGGTIVGGKAVGGEVVGVGVGWIDWLVHPEMPNVTTNMVTTNVKNRFFMISLLFCFLAATKPSLVLL